MMMTKQKGICENQSCINPAGREYWYEPKPGYPRKYCDICKVLKKQEYEDNQVVTHGPAMGKTKVFEAEDPKPEVVRPGEVLFQVMDKERQAAEKLGYKGPTQTQPKVFPKDPVGLAVDIFCSLMTIDGVADDDHFRIMGIATDLVKQAQVAFSHENTKELS